MISFHNDFNDININQCEISIQFSFHKHDYPDYETKYNSNMY